MEEQFFRDSISPHDFLFWCCVVINSVVFVVVAVVMRLIVNKLLSVPAVHDVLARVVPEDLYKVVQHKTPNDHIFAEYAKETRRIVVPSLPQPLDKILELIVSAFADTLTPDMVPLKSLYIEDAQAKLFYQLDDAGDVIKGSHLKINEQFISQSLDRGSSQSLEDLNHSSNSSLSSGGFVIPITVTDSNNYSRPPIRRPGKSRLSLVEERLTLLTNELVQKSETGSTHSAISSQTDLPQHITALPSKQLYAIIRNLHKNLMDTKTELQNLKQKELENRAEMEVMAKEVARAITEQIQCSMPKGIRRARMEADMVETEYRRTSEATYTNIKDLEVTVDVLKTDVVKRKVRLDPLQMESMERELKLYTSQISSMNDTFSTLKESLKTVMAEELEIIVNEEQFLQDEEPMLEEVTMKCEELTKVMLTLKKVAEMQRNQGSRQLEIYTGSEYDIVEERNSVIHAINTLVPNHAERVQCIQATEEFRAAQKKFVKSESDVIVEEIQHKSQNLRKTNAFEELERKREEALKNLYSSHPPHKFGRKSSQPEFSLNPPNYLASRRVSLSKCKSMSNILHQDDQETFEQSDEEYDSDSRSTEPSKTSGSSIKRSRSFSSKENEKPLSEDDKSKKKTMFAGFFSKKTKPKPEDNNSNKNNIIKESNQNTSINIESFDSTGDVFVVDTAKIKRKSAERKSEDDLTDMPRANTIDSTASRKRNPKNKNKTPRAMSTEGAIITEERNGNSKARSKKGKNR